MQLSPILSPQGEPLFVAGGPTAWKVSEYRGYVASLEWAKSRRKTIAMLVIWPSVRVFTTAVAPGQWAIARSAITEFVGFDADGRCTGGASEHLIREAREALTILGKDRNDKQALLALVDTVVKFAPELVLMPVAPLSVKRKLAGQAMWDVEAKQKSTGKTISEASV